LAAYHFFLIGVRIIASRVVPNRRHILHDVVFTLSDGTPLGTIPIGTGEWKDYSKHQVSLNVNVPLTDAQQSNPVQIEMHTTTNGGDDDERRRQNLLQRNGPSHVFGQHVCAGAILYGHQEH
jgi:hypothetical protein